MEDLLTTLGLTRTAPEDSALCYALYPPTGRGETGADLDAFALDCLAAVTPHVEGYMWQRDAFALTPSSRRSPPWDAAGKPRRGGGSGTAAGASGSAAAAAPSPSGPPCLWGVLAFGDAVDDEWFAVWLLLELTREFAGAAARAWDDDGEFLLIEAAYSLPRWLKPEVGAGRVWLRGGRVHVVPLPSARHPTLPPAPTVAEALAIVRSDAVDTLLPRVEAPVLRRVEAYPAAARANTHRARVVLPRRAAAALRGDPRLASAAAEAFYGRDPSDARAAARARRFPHRDFVSVVVPLGRCAYAQLAQQRYSPPKGSPYPSPPPGDPGHRAADLGLKLTAGLEIACARGAPAAAARREGAPPPEQQQQQQQQEEQQQQRRRLAAALADSPEWRAYAARLEAAGYFQGERRGSARHSRLLAGAREAFAASAAFADGAARAAAPAERAAAALAAAGAPWDPEAPPPGATPAAAADVEFEEGEADSDGWMAEAAAELDRQVEAREAEAAAHAARGEARRAARELRRGEQEGAAAGVGAASAAGAAGAAGAAARAAVEVDAAELAGRVRGFLAHPSSFEGAEVPQSSGGGGAGVRFDAEGFLSQLEAAMGGSGGDDKASRDEGGGGGGSAAAAAGLQALLGGLRSAARAAGIDPDATRGEDEDGDSGDSSSEEGSSFFGSGGGSDDDEDKEEHDGGGGNGREEAGPPTAPVGPGASAAAARAARQLQEERRSAPPPPRLAALQDAWEVRTATDSDDDDDDDERAARSDDDDDEDALSAGSASGSGSGSGDGDSDGDGGAFLEAYGEALEAELAATRLAESFERAPGGAGSGDAEKGRAAAAGAAAAAGLPPSRQQQQQPAPPLRPVDLDLNLVRSLVASHAGQGGLPGPASNLAGVLGLNLPTEDAPASAAERPPKGAAAGPPKGASR